MIGRAWAKPKDGLGPVVLGLWFVAAVTVLLFPFGPLAEGWRAHAARFRWAPWSDAEDLLRNVVLFLPAGWGLVRSGLAGGRGPRARILAAGAAALAVSASVEALQVLLPGRTPALADVLTNTAGGLLGAWAAVRGYGRHWRLPSPAALSGRGLVAFTLGAALLLPAHLLLVRAAARHADAAVNLSSWDPAMPLLVGDEATGDRPWRGTLHRLRIWDRALAPDELAALAADSGRRGTPLPAPLFAAAAPAPGVQDTAAGLAGRLAAAGRFTVSFVFTAADTAQHGPARLVTLSRDPWRRDFTVGQEASDLVVRLRTPLTGPNGREPELTVREAVTPGRPTFAAVVFDGGRLQVYLGPRARPADVLDLRAWSTAAVVMPDPRAVSHAGYRLLVHVWRWGVPAALLAALVLGGIEMGRRRAAGTFP